MLQILQLIISVTTLDFGTGQFITANLEQIDAFKNTPAFMKVLEYLLFQVQEFYFNRSINS